MNIYNDITLIIVCFNSYKLIQKNLSEISKFKTIIVDNSKSDEIRSLVQEVKNIKYIKTKKNLGYGKGNNLGISESKTPFILILNPDILVESASIEILYKSYFSYKNIGILAPALYDNNNNRRNNGSLSYINREKINKKNILNCLINSSGKVLLGGEPVELSNLSKKVRQKLAENDKLVISVKAHSASGYKDYVKVIDQLKQANATRISIAESD